MSRLGRLLREIPGVYDDLGHALIPARSSEPPDHSPDPRNRPAPARLDAVEHRHQLVRGLRWWVDAIKDRDEQTRVGESVLAMCAWLNARKALLEPEDAATLAGNLRSWLVKAAGIAGDKPAYDEPVTLPVEAWGRVVSQRVAAEALGVPVSTIWRRAGKRGGPVKLADVAGPTARCGACDLIVGQCPHTR